VSSVNQVDGHINLIVVGQVVVQPNRTELMQRQRRCALRPGMQVQADVVTGRTSAMTALMRKLRVLQSL